MLKDLHISSCSWKVIESRLWHHGCTRSQETANFTSHDYWWSKSPTRDHRSCIRSQQTMFYICNGQRVLKSMLWCH